MSQLACCGGSIDSGNPSGLVRQVAGNDCYYFKPADVANDGTLLVIATDVFGFKLPNARLMADSYAKELKCSAVIPDLFKGKEPPADLMATMDVLTESSSATFFAKVYAFGRLLWYFVPFMLSTSPKKSDEIIKNVVEEFRREHGVKQVAVVGYCWGGAICVRLAQLPDVVDVAVSAHPGNLSIPKDIDALVKPIGFVMAGTH